MVFEHIWAEYPHNMTARDFYEVDPEMLPMLCFVDGLYSFYGLLIRRHQEGAYGHVMMMHKPGIMASQELFFREVPVEKWMGKARLKLVYNRKWGEEERQILRRAIEERLGAPWWRRIYDVPGIIGHWVKRPGINNPFSEYCSEGVGEMIALVEDGYDLYKPTPGGLNRWCTEHGYAAYGVHDPGF